MPGVIDSHKYDEEVAALAKKNPAFADVADSFNWELLAATNFEAYAHVKDTALGEYYLIYSDPKRRTPMLVAVFGFEDWPDERKIVLHSIRESEADPSIP